MDSVQVPTGIVGAMVQVIDRAGEKGVFSGVDLTTVGTIRSELVKILQEANPPAEGEQLDGELADKVQ